MGGGSAPRYGFGQYDGLPYNQPGNDFADIYPGATLTYTLAPYNCHPTWLPMGLCKATDTICFHVVSLQGWTLAAYPPMGDFFVLGSGYLWYQDISITAPCGANIGDKDTLIAMSAERERRGGALRSAATATIRTRVRHRRQDYSADTLIVTVIAVPAVIAILQDTSSLSRAGDPGAHSVRDLQSGRMRSSDAIRRQHNEQRPHRPRDQHDEHG